MKPRKDLPVIEPYSDSGHYEPGVPLLVGYGMGVDSTAVLIEFVRRGLRPDLITFADTGGENPATYAYRPVINHFLRIHGFPEVTVVTYKVKDFKHWPPYHTLEENCLTNGTLPSLAFGFKSCSQKWKIAPQEKYVRQSGVAAATWAAGKKVCKVIGFDAGPKDMRRRNHVGGMEDPHYHYWYPLIEWGWDRERCKEEIRKAGLPVPTKSACFFCPAMQPDEVRALPKFLLRRIVLMEARARPRLTKIQGLWRNGRKGTRGGVKMPGRMTDLIREEGLLSAAELDAIIANCPKDIIDQQQAFANGLEIPEWLEYMAQFADPEADAD